MHYLFLIIFTSLMYAQSPEALLNNGKEFFYSLEQLPVNKSNMSYVSNVKKAQVIEAAKPLSLRDSNDGGKKFYVLGTRHILFKDKYISEIKDLFIPTENNFLSPIEEIRDYSNSDIEGYDKDFISRVKIKAKFLMFSKTFKYECNSKLKTEYFPEQRTEKIILWHDNCLNLSGEVGLLESSVQEIYLRQADDGTDVIINNIGLTKKPGFASKSLIASKAQERGRKTIEKVIEKVTGNKVRLKE